MSPILKKACLLIFLFTASGMVVSSMFNPEPVSGASNSSDALSSELKLSSNLNLNDDDELKPVDNMHHFMEYIYGPVYGRLNLRVKNEPSDKKGWTALKSDSLILAESSILLAGRAPEKKDAETWKKASILTYKGSSALYQAARKKDFEGVKKSFAMMQDGCKNCHEEYRE